ncbi:MAG: hypothetical protein IKE55_00195 [Kiritimatiellae bacterium]|nr:hypothetical protein [Kiritimatiellia bacterium]
MSKTIAVSVLVMSAWAAVAEPVAYVSIVRDHNGKVVEKAVGSLDANVVGPAFRVAAVGCLFAQLQDEEALDPSQLVADYLPGFKKLTLREAMVNPAGPRFVSDIVEPCIEKIVGRDVDDLLEERFWKPLGIRGKRPAIRDVYVFFRMLADNGKAEDGTRVMTPNAIKHLRHSQVPLTVNRFLSYGTKPRENGRFIGLDSTPELDAVANPDTGECAVWWCPQPETQNTELTTHNSQLITLKDKVWKASRPLRAGVFTGIGSMGLSSTELIRYVARSPELDLTLVDSADVRNGALDGLDLFVMPGGSSGVIMGDLGQKGVENLKAFVRRGGAYVGICAGCVILLDDEYRITCGMGMTPYSRYGAYSGDAMTSMTLTDEGAKALGMEKGEFDVWYSGGPIMFRRNEEVPDAKIETWGLYGSNVTNEGWGAHMKGNVSCIGGTYGKGRVASTACHPEFRHSADALAKGLFSYAAGREVTFPEPKVNKGAKKVYYYSWPVAGKECARLLTEIDADPDIDVHTDERDEMCGGALDAFDALVIPDGADWSLSYDMFPPEVEAAIAAYVAKGGKVYSWGASARHLPKGGIACRSAYDAYARLKAGK